jgi:hypothetical protein
MRLDLGKLPDPPSSCNPCGQILAIQITLCELHAPLLEQWL